MNNKAKKDQNPIKLRNELEKKEILLQEIKEKALVLLNSLADGILIIKQGAIITDANNAFCQITGIPKEHIINKSIISIIKEFLEKEDQRIVLSLIKKSKPGESMPSHEINYKSKIFKIIVSPDCTISDIAIIRMQDITETKRTEEAFRSNEEQYRNLIEHINDAIYAVNESGIFTFMSPAIEHMLGYIPCDMMGHAFTDYIYAEDIPYVLERFDKLKEGILSPGEYRVLSKSGEIIWIRTFSKPVFIENKFAGLKGTITDITERKQAELELHQHREHLEALITQRTLELAKSEERFRVAAQSTNDLIWDWDMINGTLQWFGDIDAMLGHAPQKFPRTIEAWTRIIHPDDLDRVIAALNNHLTLGTPFSEEYRIVKLDGTYRQWIQRGRALWDEKGKPFKMIGACTDITLQKETEQWVIEHAARLSAANKELERSNKDLEQFAYVASHDLQEPLRMISSFTQLLARRYQGKMDKTADEYIQFAVDGANRMQVMINDLLAYSRLSTHGKAFEFINLEEILNQVQANLRSLIEESNGVITHDSLPSVFAEISQMQQLFQNLLENAIKFRSDKQPEIHISAESKENEWVFCIQDNGIGIAPEHFERIFVIFQRLQSKDEYVGSGMGLAICKKIVERHNGKIWVESGRGNGTRFYFTLPKEGAKA